MSIVTMDGRAFSGTPAQIVRAMRELSFYPEVDLRAFVAASAARLRAVGGADIGRPEGADEDALCADFIARLLSAGAITNGANGLADHGSRP